MTRPSAARVFHPGSRWLFLLLVVAACACLLMFSQRAIALDQFADADDPLRLVQVRDWLAGQSWFDVTQYRMNPPGGAPMHWSRLVDVPIAAVILAFRPFVGQGGGETAALILVPLLTLAVVMALVRAIASKLMSPGPAVLAVIPTPVSMAALRQLAPMRIDHHGWQLVMGLTMVLAVLGDRPRRSGVIAGLAAATWLNISAEALPFIAAVGVWFGLNWLADVRAGERLRYYTATLALTASLLFGATHWPSAWGQRWCDSVSVSYLASLAIAALCCAVAVRPGFSDWRVRAAVLAVGGLLSASALWFADPQCLHDPFGFLDPLVRRYWYELVPEGLPIWRQSLAVGLAMLIQPLIGLAGGVLGWSRSAGTQRGAWGAYIFLLAAAIAASILVMREADLANLISLPGTAFLAWWALVSARKLESSLPRVAGTVVGLLLIMPAYALPLMLVKPSGNAAAEGVAPPNTKKCVTSAEVERLRQLPPGDIAAPLDLGPLILMHTPHRVIASGHHRNHVAMRDLIRFFILPPDQARTIAAQRGIDYVVVCPGMPELGNYAKDRPDGLWAMLAVGRNPAWLEPVLLPELRALRVWRVKQGQNLESPAAH
jgi:hypothetical protein